MDNYINVNKKGILMYQTIDNKVVDNVTFYTKGRAWVEINLKHLKCNIKSLKSLLPNNCEIIAVIKANAYSIGDITFSKVLNENGINNFAVATVVEAINLRKHDIKGEILIFGYTHPFDFDLLIDFDLTQTVIDYEYAKLLDSYGKQIKVHIKIDTGMHRLGELSSNLLDIERIYQCNNLIIQGSYTHLCVSNSLDSSDIAYTQLQINNFYHVINHLKSYGYNPGKMHIQSSYGILNYPTIQCDAVRCGILLHGVFSKENETTKLKISLNPILSIKARIVIIKSIQKGDPVGYNRNFVATDTMRISVISIGYADGIPRNLSNGHVIVNGVKAPIIGDICMDQIIIDITHIHNVKIGDIVTLLGQDGNEIITAEEIAAKCNTITNELIACLGDRLEHIYLDE